MDRVTPMVAVFAALVVGVCLGIFFTRRTAGTRKANWAIDPDVRFGNPEEWAAFQDRHPRFLERFPRLADTLKQTFLRTIQGEKADRLVFLLGRQCVDDFFEILTACGNAEGYAAQKLLRTMFERVVLLKYLHLNPGKVDLYSSYFHVTKHKQIAALNRFGGKDAVPAEQVREALKSYSDVKEQYRTRKCKQCGHAEMGHAWTTLALPEMAEEVGLGKFIPPAYYEPLLQAHPNLQGLLRRLEGDEKNEEGGVIYGSRLNRELSDEVLLTAHTLVLVVQDIQVKRFKLKEQSSDELAEDWKYIWENRKWR